MLIKFSRPVTINMYIQHVALPPQRNITTTNTITACASKYRTPIQMNNRFGSTETRCFTAEVAIKNENILHCKNFSKHNCIYNGAGGKTYFLSKNGLTGIL